MENKKKFLVGLPTFKGDKGFNCQTVLVSAKDEDEAYSIAKSLKPNRNIGEIKEVDY